MNLQFFKGFNENLQTVKKRFKELAFLHHPDRGGNTVVMQMINAEYAYIISNQLFTYQSDYEKDNYNEDFELRYPEVITALLKLENIFIELCGNWLWISGDTKPHRQELKNIGCMFAPKKLMWYYRPEDFKHGKTKKTMSIDYIREKFGSTNIQAPENQKARQIS